MNPLRGSPDPSSTSKGTEASGKHVDTEVMNDHQSAHFQTEAGISAGDMEESCNDSVLLQKIGSLIDKKLKDFRQEIFPPVKKRRIAEAAGSAKDVAHDAEPPVLHHNQYDNVVDHRQNFEALLYSDDCESLGSGEDQEDDFLKEIQAGYLEKEKECDPVAEQLVNTFNGLFEDNMSEKRKEELLDNYRKPTSSLLHHRLTCLFGRLCHPIQGLMT